MRADGLSKVDGMTKDAPQEAGKDATQAASRAKRCPICGKPAVAEFRAFCSRRCADVDLNRWLTGVYAVPGKADEEEDGEPAPETDRED
jgi:endogenous inhibitor of DNA gyrase (YacG/DUF329 family)